jgi:hypothetical protein
MYSIRFIYISIKFLYELLTNFKKTETWAFHFLKELEIKFNGQFDKNVIKKVAKYQTIQLFFVANHFSNLYGRNNNKIEQERNLLFFLMSVLYDNFIDEKQINEDKLDLLFYQPQHTIPSSFNERVYIYLHQSLINQVEEKNSYLTIYEKLHLVQKKSIIQFNEKTTIEEILSITTSKGGLTLLLCRHYLMTPVSNNIDNCWYALGGLIQMTNDLFDTYKDTKEGIYTFANKVKDLKAIYSIYENQIICLKKYIKSLPVSRSKKTAFAIRLSFIASFGLIAIKQISMLHDDNFRLPDFKKVERKKLIIDMEKPISIIKFMFYAYKTGALWK